MIYNDSCIITLNSNVNYDYILTSPPDYNELGIDPKTDDWENFDFDAVDEEDDDYDPTPYYLYDDTGGEPPMSADERHMKAWEEKQRLKGRR